MRKTSHSVPLRALAVLMAFTAGLSQAQAAIPAEERQFLLDFFAQTGGVNWQEKTGWGGSAGMECNWQGVTCTGDNVTELNLSNNNLSGKLPSLDALTQLKKLDVSYNSLTGSIPDLSKLSNLQDFSVNNNQLSGAIPDLSALVNLLDFRVYHNALTGTIPDLSKLTKLKVFMAYENQLNGAIPDLANLVNLQYFEVHDNQLSGALPDLSKVGSASSEDVYFRAYNNQLSGPLLDAVKMGKVHEFSVSFNQLTGAIPDLSSLSALRVYNVRDNLLNGTVSGVSPSLYQAFICGNSLQKSSSDALNIDWGTVNYSGTVKTPDWFACQKVALTGVNLSPNVLAFAGKATLSPTPANASLGTCTSSNPAIASVSGTTVTAGSTAGSVTVTCSGKSAAVTVGLPPPPTLTGIALESVGTILQFGQKANLVAQPVGADLGVCSSSDSSLLQVNGRQVTAQSRAGTASVACQGKRLSLIVAPARSISVTGKARVRPQVIMAGIDPMLIHHQDSSFKVFALVRPGQAEVTAVDLKTGDASFSQPLNFVGTYKNGDQLWSFALNFPAGTFNQEAVLSDLFGSKAEQFHFKVLSKDQNEHRFPGFLVDTLPLNTNPAASPGIAVVADPQDAPVKREWPQVLAAGFDPQLIDFDDTSFNVVAIVRPGINAVQTVTLAQNGGGFSQGMQLLGSLPNGDLVYGYTLNYPKATFASKTEAADLFGSMSGQFRILASDQNANQHAFPELLIGNFPLR